MVLRKQIVRMGGGGGNMNGGVTQYLAVLLLETDRFDTRELVTETYRVCCM